MKKRSILQNALAMLVTASCSVGVVLPAIAQPSGEPFFGDRFQDCKSSMARCWFMVFGTGEASNRKLYLADFRVRPTKNDTVEIDAVEVHETHPKQLDHLVWTLEFRCKSNEFRAVKGYAFLRDGKVESAESSKWMQIPPNWLSHAGKAACSEEVRRSPGANLMGFLGNMYRPVDAADLIRQYLWTEDTVQR
ncbi:hypothetical protein A0J48_014315 [Sphaerospermopsis aphanizomenoides BCCUSP55]|uniref:hypothetical protein n=1 Tax=Sphaerospermopsis aphanizomenoides TaxID=459663 RepID=UPI0019035854|nr:hypothetical protein [Sphaerospermopsis aphanizomenoides]MBK1988698.1 hypothetical protein [Sphaerospermopsis aphanizomenoides BCCUSP55]